MKDKVQLELAWSKRIGLTLLFFSMCTRFVQAQEAHNHDVPDVSGILDMWWILPVGIGIAAILAAGKRRSSSGNTLRKEIGSVFRSFD